MENPEHFIYNENKDTLKIGIYFGDNDFWRTSEAFLKVLKSGELNHHADANKLTLKERYTKQRIVNLFNKIGESLYWINQNGFSYDLQWNASEYLQIDLDDVYLDEEIKELLKSKDYDNEGEYTFVSLENIENKGYNENKRK